jgi:methyltransferase (TIGR00027 family)
MRDGRGSRTAQHNALFRALDARKPESERIADDRLAVHLLPAGFRAVAELARVGLVRRGVESFIDAKWPGPRAGVVTRTRLIDDIARACSEDVSQAVLLGAGLDSRPYRLPAMRSLVTFEVDHPSTQAYKRRSVQKVVGSTPHVRFVAVDFGRDDLGEALIARGFDTGQRTLLIWEGVTNYLTAEAVDATFEAIARLVPSGSVVVFTYIDRRMLEGTLDFDGARESAEHVERVGEPYTFGFDPREVAAYVDERGFDLISDVSVAEASHRYANNGPSKGYAYYYVAEARRR